MHRCGSVSNKCCTTHELMSSQDHCHSTGDMNLLTLSQTASVTVFRHVLCLFAREHRPSIRSAHANISHDAPRCAHASADARCAILVKGKCVSYDSCYDPDSWHTQVNQAEEQTSGQDRNLRVQHRWYQQFLWQTHSFRATSELKAQISGVQRACTIPTLALVMF